ncbi:MAG: hypothetical protein JWO22_3208 [Frankiales bacterium]|nr:hypothetical protein [Frankiales bacterium]
MVKPAPAEDVAVDIPALVSEIAEPQSLIVTRRQLCAAGVPRWYTKNELRQRRWQSCGRQSLAVHNGPLDHQALCWVAVLEVGLRAALDEVCALQAAGVKGLSDTDIVVATPKGSTPGKPPGVTVRETRRYRAEDVIVVGIPRIRPAVAAVHAALRAKSDRQAKLFIVMTVQQRVTPIAQVVEAAAAVKRHVRRRLIASVVADLAAGAQSLGEIDVGAGMRRRGLPEPSRQSVRKRPDGTEYLDIEWPEFRLVLEIDGAGHDAADQALKDFERDLRIIGEERYVMRLKLAAWALDQERVLDALEQVLIDRGWRRDAA